MDRPDIEDTLFISTSEEDELSWFHPDRRLDEEKSWSSFSMPVGMLEDALRVPVTGRFPTRGSAWSDSVFFGSVRQLCGVCGFLLVDRVDDACLGVTTGGRIYTCPPGPFRQDASHHAGGGVRLSATMELALIELGYYWLLRDAWHFEQAERLLGTGDAPLQFVPGGHGCGVPDCEEVWKGLPDMLDRVRGRLRMERGGKDVNMLALPPWRVRRERGGDFLVEVGGP